MEVNNMTLDEAIAHCNEVAGACDTGCRREHKQLADWLRELKDRRHYQGGNAAAMREALKAAIYCLKNRWTCSGYTVEETVDKIRSALAAPARNCDVGTAEEHFGKFENFCKTMKNFCKTMKNCDCCPCNLILKNGERRCNCFVWAQMTGEEMR